MLIHKHTMYGKKTYCNTIAKYHITPWQEKIKTLILN